MPVFFFVTSVHRVFPAKGNVEQFNVTIPFQIYWNSPESVAACTIELLESQRNRKHIEELLAQCQCFFANSIQNKSPVTDITTQFDAVFFQVSFKCAGLAAAYMLLIPESNKQFANVEKHRRATHAVSSSWGFGGLSPAQTKLHPTISNMKHYKWVEIYQILGCQDPLHKCKALLLKTFWRRFCMFGWV